jgi:hypothetical protein
MYMCIYVCICKCICMHVFVCTNTHMYTYKHTHLHTHTHTHTGLVGYLGYPNDTDPLAEMYREHCEYEYSKCSFTTTNYGNKKNSQKYSLQHKFLKVLATIFKSKK